MTVSVNLPHQIERAYQAAAESKGMTVDAFVADILVSNAPIAEASTFAQLVIESGIPVLHTGQPLNLDAISDTIQKIRLERDLSLLGRS